MLNKELPKYSQLPILSQKQISAFNPNHVIFYDELIIDVQHFSHPGTSLTMQSYLSKNITQIFLHKNHSYNAKLMLMNMSIGRRSQKQGMGYKLYRELIQSKTSQIHQKMINQIDMSKGILKQISKYTKQQIQIFVSIPKYYTNSNQIMFNQTKWQQFFWLDRFWVSTTIFTLIITFIAYYLFINGQLFSSMYKIGLFMIGIFMWTMIEYYFHRIKLHVPIYQGMILNPHYVHHAFPNLKNKIALSINKNLLIEFIGYQVMIRLIGIEHFNALHIVLGLHTFLTLYDILHYYFHFGPEINIPILRQLKKNHMKHHFRDSDRGFGVTTTLWDHVFGTLHIVK